MIAPGAVRGSPPNIQGSGQADKDRADKARAKAQKLLTKYPGSIPVVCRKASGSDLPDMDKKQFLVPRVMLCEEFKDTVRKHIKHTVGVSIQSAQLICLSVHDVMLDGQIPMSELYAQYKADDFLLHIDFSVGCQSVTLEADQQAASSSTQPVRSQLEPAEEKVPSNSEAPISAEARKILAKHPHSIPIVCEKASGSDAPGLRKKRFLVPETMLCSEFTEVVRKHVKEEALTSSETLSERGGAAAVSLMSQSGAALEINASMRVLYEHFRAGDGFLYLTYAMEATVTPSSDPATQPVADAESPATDASASAEPEAPIMSVAPVMSVAPTASAELTSCAAPADSEFPTAPLRAEPLATQEDLQQTEAQQPQLSGEEGAQPLEVHRKDTETIERKQEEHPDVSSSDQMRAKMEARRRLIEGDEVCNQSEAKAADSDSRASKTPIKTIHLPDNDPMSDAGEIEDVTEAVGQADASPVQATSSLSAPVVCATTSQAPATAPRTEASAGHRSMHSSSSTGSRHAAVPRETQNVSATAETLCAKSWAPRSINEEAARMLAKYPDRVPVICRRAPGREAPELSKTKFLVPGKMFCSEFKYLIHQQLRHSGHQGLASDQTIYLFLNSTSPKTCTLMADLYDQYKADDGYLYFTYSLENTLGST